ncbi:MAG: murein biosynthesis integral membrane protein MurJ [Anaerolineae bacterium]
MTSRAGQLARAATIVMAAFVASRALGLVREMIIARQFGTSLELGAYLAAFRVPDIIFQLIAGGALGSAFIPTFTGYLAHGDEAEAWRLASAVFNIAALLLTACALVAALFAPRLATLIVPGFDPQAQALTARLMRLMLISPVVFGLSGISMGVLNSYQHFLLPALAPVVYNLSIIGGALFLAPILGIHGLAVGVVVGSGLHLLIQVPMLLRKGLTYTPALLLDHPGVREIGRLMLPRVAGLAAVQVNFLVNTILASGLGEEALPALNYAWLLMLLPQGVFAMAIATALFPTFSELAAREQTAELRRTLSAALRVVWYLTIPASVGLVILQRPLIRALLERGRFTGASTDAVAWALGFYALGLFAHATVEIVTRAYYALHDTRTPVLIGVGAMACNVALSLILIRPLLHGGLALANSMAAILEMLVLVLVLRARLGGVDGRRLVGSLARIGAAAGLMGLAVTWFVQARWLSSPLFLVGGGVFLGTSIYFAASLLLGAQEVAALRRLVRRWREE